MERDRFEKILADLLRVDTHFGDTEVTFTSARGDRFFFSPLSVDRVDQLLKDVASLRFDDLEPIIAYTDHSAEMAVDYLDAHSLRRLRDDIEITDSASGTSYRLGRASGAHLVALADRIARLPSPERPRLNAASMSWRYEHRDGNPADLLDALAATLRIDTLRVTSTQKLSKTNWRSLADSFFFHLGYNLDLSIVLKSDLSTLGRASRIQRLRRARPQDLDAPRSSYSAELVRSYQVAISAESAMLSYLSFYHIAEHWFEEILVDSIASKLQSRIAAPGFSTKRKSDMREIIMLVSKSIKSRDEDLVQINEETSLLLTLERFVNLDELKSALDSYDSGILEYLATTTVAFSEGSKVTFSNGDDHTTIKQLTQRIYKTRNSLVHRKRGSRGRFTPFVDDGPLNKELPLMRFIAEQIIIGSSSRI